MTNLKSQRKEERGQSFFRSDKDKTSLTLGDGVYRIPCSSGRFYIRRTQLQLGERLLEHMSSIDKVVRLRQRSEVLIPPWLNICTIVRIILFYLRAPSLLPALKVSCKFSGKQLR